MQQSSALSDEAMSSRISMPSVTSLQDQSSAKTSQHGAADRAYDAENIFSSYASVKLKLVQASNNRHEEMEDEAPGSVPSSQLVTSSRDLFSDTSDHGTVVNSEMASASGFAVGLDPTAASQTLNEDTSVYNEVDDDTNIPGVDVNEAVTPAEQDVAADTRPADTGPTQAEVSVDNICVMGHRNPEFYSPTRKLDFTKKLSNKGLDDPLPGDAEETVTAKKKHNPLKRLFARKKGKFDPVSTDLFQSELPCTVQEIGSHSSKKHESLQSKLKMKMGKKKSREVLDLNSSSGVGSNLEIDQIQDIKEGLSKGKCKNRGKLTKENIIVLKSTGKLLSQFGNGSLETVSVTDEEQMAQEPAPYIGNRDSNGSLGQADDNQGPDDDDDDLQHLDDMLEHIYANYASMDPVLSFQGQPGHNLYTSDGDEVTGVGVTVHAGEIGVEIIAGKVQTEETGRENIDDEAPEGGINRDNIDVDSPALEIGRGNIDGKGETTNRNDDSRETSMGNCNDNAHTVETNVDNFSDNVRKGNIHTENTVDEVDDSATRTTNFGKFQGPEKCRNTEGKLLGELIPGNNCLNKNLKMVENMDGELQGGEINVENVDDKLQDQKLSIDNINYIYDTCATVAAEFHLSDIDIANPIIAWKSEHFRSLGDSGLTEDSTDRLDGLEERMGSLGGDKGSTDYSVCGVGPRNATMRSLGEAGSTPASDKIRLDVNLPDTVTDNTTDDCVEGASIVDDEMKADTEADSSAPCWSAPVTVGVMLPDFGTSSLTNSSVTTQDGVLHDGATARGDNVKSEDVVRPSLASQPSVSAQTGVGPTHDEPEGVSSDLDTNDATKLEIIICASFPALDTESAPNTNLDPLHKQSAADVSNLFTELVEDQVEFSKSPRDPIVRDKKQTRINQSGIVQSEIRSTRLGQSVDDLLLFPDNSTIHIDDTCSSNRQVHTVHDQLHPSRDLHDQLRPAGLQLTANITHNQRKPPVKPKPLTVQSFVHTTPVSNTNAQAGDGRHPLTSDRAVEHWPVDDPALKVQPRAETFMSVESVNEDILGKWSENQGTENIKENQPDCVGGSSSGELSSVILTTLSGYAQEHLSQAESPATNSLNANLSADVSNGVNIDDHATDEVGDTDERAVDKEKVTSEIETQGNDFLEKSSDHTLESRGLASQEAGRFTSTTSTCGTSAHPHMSQLHTGLSADDVLHKKVSARLLVGVGETCEHELSQTQDSTDDHVVNKPVDKNSGFSSNSNIDADKGAVTDNGMLSISEGRFKTTEKTHSQDDKSTTYTCEPSARDTGSSRYYECVVDKTTSNDGHKDNAETAIEENSKNDGASDYPDNNVVNLSSSLELKSCMNVHHGDTDRDNIYEEISEEIYVKDVSCLTSKRFQFPWKKREKKSDKRGDMNGSNNLGAKEKGKPKPTKGKPAIKPKPVLQVSECLRSRPYVHNDKPPATKRRSGKVKKRSGSFTLPVEESLYNEIDEDRNHRQDVMEEYSSSSSSTSDDDLSYETINYTEDIKKGDAAGLPQETRDYPKSPLYSADSLGYEIPAKISLTGIERTKRIGAADTSRGEHLANQDFPSTAMGTEGADGKSQLALEPDSSSCEDLPTFGEDTKWGFGKLDSSSVSTDLTLTLAEVTSYERSYSQTVLSGGMSEAHPQAPHETASGDDKALAETFHAENAGTCQSFARIQVNGLSAGNTPTKVVSLDEITENIDPECSQMLQGITLGGSNQVSPISTTAESSIARCANAVSTTAESSNARCANAVSTKAESNNAGCANAVSTTAESSNAGCVNANSTTAESNNAGCANAVSTTAESSNARCANANSTTTESSNAGCASSHNSSTTDGIEDSSRGRAGCTNVRNKELDISSKEERVTCRHDQPEDRICGGYDTGKPAQNTSEDSFSRLKSGIDQKTSRIVDRKRSIHSEEAGKVSTNLRTKVIVDAHIMNRQQSALDVDTQTIKSHQSVLEVDKKVTTNVVKNREMLAGYNQVVKSLAAFFVSNKDSENMEAKPDHTSSLEIRCSETQERDFPDKLPGQLSSRYIPQDLHPADAASTHPQSTSCVSEPETESRQFVLAGSGISSQGDNCQKEIQGHQTVLLSAARSPPPVPSRPGRRSLSLRHTDTSYAKETATVTRSFESRIYTGSNSHGSRPKVLRRTCSWPACLKSQTCKVTHSEFGSGSFSAPSTGKSNHIHHRRLRQQQSYKTKSVNLVLRKPVELPKSRSGQEVITSTDATIFPSNQAGTNKHKNNTAVPPIPDTVAIRKTQGTVHLTVATENEGGDTPEYDLPPVRTKRISQSKIFSWPGLSISGTSQPPVHTGVLAPAERPYPAGSNRTEYAAPWEGKGLETFGPAPAPHNMPPSMETVQEPDSSQPKSCGQLATDGSPTSRSTETLDRRFVFSLGSRGKPIGAGHDDSETTKMFGKKHRKLPSEEEEEGDLSVKKSGFIRMMTSLFHRKKKTFNVHDNHPDGDERSSFTSEEDSAAFDVTEAPPEVANDALPSPHTEGPVSAVIPSTLSSGDNHDSSMATVTRVRPLCRLLKLEDDQTRTIELVQPWLHYQGLTFTRDSPQPDREGVFVAPFADRGSSKLLAGFLDVGDQVLQVDGLEVSDMSLREINFLVQSKQQMTIRISPKHW